MPTINLTPRDLHASECAVNHRPGHEPRVTIPFAEETASEDIRNALAVIGTVDPENGAPVDGSVLVEIRARLTSALRKLENPATGRVGAGTGIVARHPGVPASLYMVSE